MSEVASSFASVWLTYLVRSLAAYTLLWLICRIVRDRRLRFQLCAVFLGTMVTTWLGLLARTGPAGAAVASATHPVVTSLPWQWILHLAPIPRLPIVLSYARWAYVVLVTLLWLQLGVRFWKLRMLLRASQKPPETLRVLFESARSGIRASRSELRLVPDLRSPATTGWWRPKVLLPCDFASRLEPHQLADVLRHELMHVQRQDYLWDGLATLGSYLLFFHPAAWLVRRRMRWERELICDEGVVDATGIGRIEYAACLTTVARWRWVPEVEPATSIDFVSSSSLLAARVQALVSPRGAQYSARKKAMLGLLAGAALAATAWLAPEITVISGAGPTEASAAVQESSNPALSSVHQQQPRLTAERPVLSKHQKTPAGAIIPRARYSHLVPAKLSTAASTRSSPVSRVLPASPETQTQENSTRQPNRLRFVQRVGSWTVHTMKFGVARLQAIGGKHPRAGGSLPDPTSDNSTKPL